MTNMAQGVSTFNKILFMDFNHLKMSFCFVFYIRKLIKKIVNLRMIKGILMDSIFVGFFYVVKISVIK